jgi:alkanesulfonate monooxygenase SsuD/methylene tetrahydromethanopterin reductase-like flavin-dependent oxidoreductase (luciferase family)
VAQRGIDDNPYRLGFLQLVCVSESDASAQAEYEEHVQYFYRKMLRIHPPFAESPGYRSIASIRESIRPQIGEEAQKAARDLDWKDFVEQGHVIAGSPATVRDRLTEAIKMLRVGHLMCLLQIGSMPKDLTLKNTELFAREVMPAIRDLWSGYHDPWWPQRLAQEQPAPVGD